MAASVTFDGYREFRQLLEQYPEAVQTAVTAIVASTVTEVATQLRAVYPPGPMRDGVQTSMQTAPGTIGVRGAVLSATPQAHWWEFGTVVRTTQQGWNRGSEPAHPDQGLIPIAITHRTAMHEVIQAMLTELGFLLTGTP